MIILDAKNSCHALSRRLRDSFAYSQVTEWESQSIQYETEANPATGQAIFVIVIAC